MSFLWMAIITLVIVQTFGLATVMPLPSAQAAA